MVRGVTLPREDRDPPECRSSFRAAASGVCRALRRADLIGRGDRINAPRRAGLLLRLYYPVHSSAKTCEKAPQLETVGPTT